MQDRQAQARRLGVIRDRDHRDRCRQSASQLWQLFHPLGHQDHLDLQLLDDRG